MTLLQITIDQDRMCEHGTSKDVGPALSHQLTTCPGPVTIMVHGYKYLPGHAQHCPHESLFATRPTVKTRRIVSWPHRLGLRGQPGDGIGISFGWNARGTIWRAHKRAIDVGGHLTDLLNQIRRQDPSRAIHLVAHSLGARVVLNALLRSAPGTVSRVILLAAAEFGETARAAMLSEGGRGCAVLNVTSRENDLFDFLLERLVSAPCSGDRMMGHGLLDLPNLATLQLDDIPSLARLRRAGYPIAETTTRICHWSPYLRPGVFPVYRAFLSGSLNVERLQTLTSKAAAPRWSRLVRTPLPLPRRRVTQM